MKVFVGLGGVASVESTTRPHPFFSSPQSCGVFWGPPPQQEAKGCPRHLSWSGLGVSAGLPPKPLRHMPHGGLLPCRRLLPPHPRPSGSPLMLTCGRGGLPSPPPVSLTLPTPCQSSSPSGPPIAELPLSPPSMPAPRLTLFWPGALPSGPPIGLGGLPLPMPPCCFIACPFNRAAGRRLNSSPSLRA